MRLALALRRLDHQLDCEVLAGEPDAHAGDWSCICIRQACCDPDVSGVGAVVVGGVETYPAEAL